MRKSRIRKIFVSIFLMALITIQGVYAQQHHPTTNTPQTGASSSQMQMPMGQTSQQSGMMQQEMMQNHTQMMLRMLGPADQNYDLRFINMMIMHHQVAIKMAQDALCKAQHPELRQKAQDIINAQTQEIEQLKTWRKQWYGQ
ncbi:MAG: hypothetical protein A2287_10125 [Candidatus Melainabacteria bacterium RIFOXYA12_FULL_32_12]|nr:MAG: hypothetical protein A2287_10125 [Candidatus Melainabacteria bacterium RIFOXYA12_FULL_32_12]